MNGNRISKTVGMFIGNFGRKDKKCRYSLKSMTGQGKDFFFFFFGEQTNESQKHD